MLCVRPVFKAIACFGCAVGRPNKRPRSADNILEEGQEPGDAQSVEGLGAVCIQGGQDRGYSVGSKPLQNVYHQFQQLSLEDQNKFLFCLCQDRGLLSGYTDVSGR